MKGCAGARVTSHPTAKTAFCCSPYFRFWPYPEVLIAVHGVRLSEKSGKLLLGLSFTESDPTRTPSVHRSTCEVALDFERLANVK